MLYPSSFVTSVFHERTRDGIFAVVGADAHIGPCNVEAAEILKIMCT